MTDTPVMVRTSERTKFVKCRMAWWWSYKEKRQPMDQWSRALVFGDMVHRALAAYYIPETRKKRRRGPHPAATFTKIYDIMSEGNGRKFSVKVDDEFWIGARDLGEEMMINYVDQWRDDDSYIVVIYPEMPFQYLIMDPETGLPLCIYVGTTDAFIYDLRIGRYGLFEHKTAAAITTDHLFLDEQASSYWCLVPRWLLENEIIKPGQKMDFMLYNFMRKAQKDTREQDADGHYLNLNGSVSKRQPAPLFHREPLYRGEIEQANTFQRILEQVREMNMVRSGEMPHYKAPSRDCVFCEWKDICELHETGSDWRELKKITTKKWSPYQQHVWEIDLDAA